MNIKIKKHFQPPENISDYLFFFLTTEITPLDAISIGLEHGLASPSMNPNRRFTNFRAAKAHSAISYQQIILLLNKEMKLSQKSSITELSIILQESFIISPLSNH